MPKRDYNVYVDDILESINKIEDYMGELDFEQFSKDTKTIDAIVRNFEIIGEATKHIPAKIKKRYPDVPWKLMAGMRDKLIHEYFGVDKQVLWKTIKEDFVPVKPLIEKLQKDSKLL